MILRLSATLSLVLVLSALLGACSSEDASTDGTAPDESGTRVLTAADAGSSVEIAEGGALEVMLESNPTTGYTWTVDEDVLDTAVLTQDEGEPEFVVHDATLIGSPGDLITHFTAGGAGETTLRMLYHQPWDEGAEPAETYEVTVVVK